MADRLQALIALKEAVENDGSVGVTLSATDAGLTHPLSQLVNQAYRGSLDAARDLHEAVLPGFIAKPVIGGQGAGVRFWHCEIEHWDEGEEYYGDNQPCPARAWLLAILAALIAQEQANG